MPVNKTVSWSPEGLGSGSGIPDLVELSESPTTNCQALVKLLKDTAGQTAHRTEARRPKPSKGRNQQPRSKACWVC